MEIMYYRIRTVEAVSREVFSYVVADSEEEATELAECGDCHTSEPFNAEIRGRDVPAPSEDVETVSEDTYTCLLSGAHLKSCDTDGFCNICGDQ